MYAPFAHRVSLGIEALENGQEIDNDKEIANLFFHGLQSKGKRQERWGNNDGDLHMEKLGGGNLSSQLLSSE